MEKVADDFSDIVKVKELGWMGREGGAATVCHIDGLPPLQNSQWSKDAICITSLSLTCSGDTEEGLGEWEGVYGGG